MESKAEFIHRLNREQRFEEYSRQHRALCERGMDPKQARERLQTTTFAAPVATAGPVVPSGESESPGQPDIIPMSPNPENNELDQIGIINAQNAFRTNAPPAMGTVPQDFTALAENMSEDWDIVEAVQWTMTYIGQQNIPQPPTAVALAMLNWARSSPQAQTDFYKTFAARLMPSKADVDSASRIQDDHNETFDKLKAFIAARKEMA